jgi:hypothetical protein
MANTEAQVQEAAIDEQVDDASVNEDAEVGSPVRYVISSYGADYPVDGLVKRISRGDVYVPEFQRGFVWSHAQASRFVESLLLGLPVPGIFLFKEPDTQKLVVVDGQQRLRTLEKYYEGVLRGREFALRGVADEMNGLTYRTLSEEARRGLDDAILHATIFQQEDPKDDRSSIYLIFERLNTGGTPLAPQEIRSCVYRGSLDDLLKTLAQHPKWREIYGPPSNRGKDQELILRFFALYYNAQNYQRPLKGFLNDFMNDNRKAPPARIAEMQQLFERTVSTAADTLGRSAFRPERNLNAAVLDAFFVGLARRLAQGPLKNQGGLKPAADGALSNVQFQAAVTSSTTDVTAISRRLELATAAFASVQ